MYTYIGTSLSSVLFWCYRWGSQTLVWTSFLKFPSAPLCHPVPVERPGAGLAGVASWWLDLCPCFLYQVADMLLELCVTELEDVATDSQSGRLSSQPVVVESSHPYTDDTSSSGTVKIPGIQCWSRGRRWRGLPLEHYNCISRSNHHHFIEKKLQNWFRMISSTFPIKTFFFPKYDR